MQLSGGIYSEYLNEQHLGASLARNLHFRLPGAATYLLRWFVLDGMILRYYKGNNVDETELGRYSSRRSECTKSSAGCTTVYS